MNSLRALAAVIVLLTAAVIATAQDKLFDNWNTAACGYTDSASFRLPSPAHLNEIQVWYHWRGRESSISYSILHDGQTIRNGTLTREECDPYQEAWCAARDSIDIEAEPGTYTIRTDRSRLCQNDGSSGTGFVKVFGRSSPFERERRHDLGRLAADVWRVEEGLNGRPVWVGTWTRRGRSNVFDAVWRNVDTGEEAHDTLRLIESGERIVFHRDGQNGEYRGRLSRDGEHMDGTASWYSDGWFWRARTRERAHGSDAGSHDPVEQ